MTIITGLSVALLISVDNILDTKSSVSCTTPWTCGTQRMVYGSWTRLQSL